MTEEERRLMERARACARCLVENSDAEKTKGFAEKMLLAFGDNEAGFNNCDVLMGFAAMIVSNIRRMPAGHQAPTAVAISMIIAEMLGVSRVSP